MWHIHEHFLRFQICSHLNVDESKITWNSCKVCLSKWLVGNLLVWEKQRFELLGWIRIFKILLCCMPFLISLVLEAFPWYIRNVDVRWSGHLGVGLLLHMGGPERHSSLLLVLHSDYFNELYGLILLQQQDLIHSYLNHNAALVFIWSVGELNWNILVRETSLE